MDKNMTQSYAIFKKSPSNIIISVGKRIKNDILANTNPKKAGVAATLDKVDFRRKLPGTLRDAKKIRSLENITRERA